MKKVSQQKAYANPAMATSSVFLVKESQGIYCLNGPPKFEKWDEFKQIDEETRFTAVSPNNEFIAIGTNSIINVYHTSNGSLKCMIPKRVLSAQFSPKGSYLLTWDNPSQQHDNFNIWKLNGDQRPSTVHSLKLSKQPDIQISGDETVCARLSNNSVLFSNIPDFHSTATKSPENMKISKFSVSTGHSSPLHVLCYIPSTVSGQPSFARLYRYPNFSSLIASKSFFQADRVEMKWNQKGTAVLLITSTDVDKTGQSYYGKTMLHYLDTKGETATVQTDTDSPVIHAAEWSPTGTEFCVITGKMPNTRAAIFNAKCEVIFDMGVSARNAIYFNPQGNIVLLCGFGNLAHGKIEVWELKRYKKQITTATAPTTTQLSWLSDGVHFLTATTAPRMQVGNCFKIFDFTGKLCHEWNAPKHLYGATPFLSGVPPAFPDDKLDAHVGKLGNKPAATRIEEKKPAAYVPPSRRANAPGMAPSKTQGQVSGKGNKTATESTLSEKEKKIRTVKKKLEKIEKLKEMLKEGKPVEKNQMDTLANEGALLMELETLSLS